MQRHLQDLERLQTLLSPITTNWKDEFANNVLQQYSILVNHDPINANTLKELLENDWDAGLTVIRLFLEYSKDEFRIVLRGLFPDEKSIGKTFFKKNSSAFVEKLINYGVLEQINNVKRKTYSWQDILTERLKLGRGSAIKGQQRGRYLEDFVEDIIKQVFNSYDLRCNFAGKQNNTEAKADFAIPHKGDPSIVIEVKAYGATGSKQTDSIGDVEKIIQNKRHDTYFLFVTDGITWLDRLSDLRKIIQYQNEGFIYRIYTQKMAPELLEDLKQMKSEIIL